MIYMPPSHHTYVLLSKAALDRLQDNWLKRVEKAHSDTIVTGEIKSEDN
jgi:hypothetical protein